MSSQSRTVGTIQWKEASKAWRIYAYNPASTQSTSAEGVTSRRPNSVSNEFTRETFLGALTRASRQTSEPDSKRNGTSE
jgi:hypothetical protein